MRCQIMGVRMSEQNTIEFHKIMKQFLRTIDPVYMHAHWGWAGIVRHEKYTEQENAHPLMSIANAERLSFIISPK